MSKLKISTKNQFKETTRYLQEQLSKELGEHIKLSTIQEAVSKSMGFNDMQHYIHTLKIIQAKPPVAQYANGDITMEVQSLHFLINAANGGSGTQVHIRTVLLHMYNSINPMVLWKIKGYDQEHTIHMMNVFALDSRYGKEIHDYINDGHKIFSTWANEAHENREYSKHKDNIYSFCESVEKIQNFSHEPDAQDKDFIKRIFKDWEYCMRDLKCTISPVNINTNGLYVVEVSARDQYNYGYSVCVYFNFINGLIYVCEEPGVNEECSSKMLHSNVNQAYQDDCKEYGDDLYPAHKNYFNE